MNLNHISRFLRAPDGGAGAGGGGGGGDGGAGAGAGGAAGAGAGQGGAIDFRSFIGQDGAFVKPDWAGEEKDAAAKFKSLPDLWKSYRTLERINSSGNKVAVPTDASTPEEWDAFYSRVRGVGKEDDYKVEVPEALKGKLPIDEAAIKQFKGLMYKNGATSKSVEAAAKWYFENVGATLAAVEQQTQARLEASVRDLEKEWGPKDGAKWKENLALAERGAAIAGLTADVLKTTPELANNPHFIRAMAKIAMTTKEGGTPNPGSNGGGSMGGNPRAEIQAILNDKEHPYWIKDHPGHKAAVDQMAALHARAAAASGA